MRIFDFIDTTGRVGVLMLFALFFVDATHAACIKNDADRTLYAVMTSPSGTVEKSIWVGAEICQAVGKGERVQVNILPYGGARFGCRVNMRGSEAQAITRFDTMNRCKFTPLR